MDSQAHMEICRPRGWGARIRQSNERREMGKMTPRDQIQINFSHEERRLSQTGLSRLHQAALLHSAGGGMGEKTPEESLCPPNSPRAGTVGTVGPRGKGGQGSLPWVKVTPRS